MHSIHKNAAGPVVRTVRALAMQSLKAEPGTAEGDSNQTILIALQEVLPSSLLRTPRELPLVQGGMVVREVRLVDDGAYVCA